MNNIFEAIFPHFDELYADKNFDAKKFKQNIETSRASLNISKDILKDDGKTINYKDLSEVPNGRFTIVKDDMELQSLFIPYKDSKELIVVLGAALTEEKIEQLPQFSAWSWTNRLAMNYLYIEDPMYFKYQDSHLLQSWFYEGKDIKIRKNIADLILKVAELKQIPKQNINLYGLSAACSAAMAIGKLIDGCCVFGCNPQINFKDYYYSKNFQKITGIDIVKDSQKGQANDILYNIDKSNTKFVIMINAFSLADSEVHLKYLSQYFNFTPKLGFNTISKNFVLWLYNTYGVKGDNNSSHTAFPSINFVYILLWLGKVLQTNGNINNYRTLDLLFNEFYSLEYSYKNQIYQLQQLANEELDNSANNKTNQDYELSNASKPSYTIHNWGLNPKVSVIIPVYNTSDYLERCLDSVINQTLKEIEIICINDGSTDNSYSILEKYLKQDNRMILVNHYNKNVFSVRNEGIRLATGEYVCFLDSDDTLDSSFLAKLYEISDGGKADIVKGNMLLIDKNGNSRIDVNNSRIEKQTSLLGKLTSFSQHTSLMYKTSILKENKIIYPPYKYKEDVAFVFCTKLFCKDFKLTDEVFYNYFYNRPTSLSNTVDDDKIRDAFRVLIYQIDFLNNIKDMGIDIYARFAYEIVQAGVHRSKSYLLKHNSSVFVAECLNYYRIAISKIKNLDLVKEKFPGIFWKKIEDTDEIFLSYLKPKDA